MKPASLVVKNPPASEGYTGPISGLRGSHMPQRDEASAPQLLSFCSRAQELQLLSSCVKLMKPTQPRAHGLKQEKSPQ